MVRICGKSCHDGVEGSTSHGSFDATVCHQTSHQGNILNGVAQRTSHRSRKLECFAHHADIRVRIGRCSGQHVREHSCIGSLQAEGSQGIRYDVRGRAKVFVRGSSQLHNTGDAIQHIFRFPTGHGHIVKSLSRIGGGKFCGGTHLFCLLGQLLKLIGISSAHGLHLRHGSFKVFLGVDGIGQPQTYPEKRPRLKQGVF